MVTKAAGTVMGMTVTVTVTVTTGMAMAMEARRLEATRALQALRRQPLVVDQVLLLRLL